MPRALFDDTKVHPAIRDKIAAFHPEMVAEATRAIAEHPVVVIGMKQNPFPKRAKKALAAHGTAFHYLEYGSYLGDYRKRLALKMWTGWSTFPMIFVKGTFIGGAEDLEALLASGEFDKLLAA
ncbi:hypothetical protein BH11MYX1_BH11MYX1_15640 [soil metagenome]